MTLLNTAMCIAIEDQIDDLCEMLISHLSNRGPGWATAREIAAEIGFPWRKVARTMIKMPQVEKQAWTWASSRGRTRDCLIYRHVPAPTAIYPAWLMPQAPEIKIGQGRVIRMMSDD